MPPTHPAPEDLAPQEPPDPIRRRRRRVALGALLALGAVLRTVQAVGARSLWRDEVALGLNFDNRGPADLLLHPLEHQQMAPPGFLAAVEFVTEVWEAAASSGGTRSLAPDLAFRLVPWLLGLLGLVAAWRALCLVVRGPALRGPVVRGPVLLAALAPFVLGTGAVYYDAAVKPYGADVAACLLLLWASLRVLEEPADRRRALQAGWLVGPLLLFSFPAVPLAGCLVLVLLVHALWSGPASEASQASPASQAFPGRTPPRRARIEAWLHLALPWGLFASLTAFFVLRLRGQPLHDFMVDYWRDGFPSWESPVGALTFLPRHAAGSLQHYLFFRGPELAPTAFLAWMKAAAALLLLLAAWGAWSTLRRSPWRAAVLALPLGVAMALAALRLYPYLGRLGLWTVPSLLLLAAAGCDDLRRRLGRRARHAAAALGVGAVLLPVALSTAWLQTPPIETQVLRPVVEELTRRLEPGDVVYVPCGGGQLGLRFYGKRTGLAAASAQGFVEVIRGACHHDRAGYLAEAQKLTGRPRVWLFHSHRPRGHAEWVLEHYQISGRQLDVLDDPLGRTGLGSTRAFLFDLSAPPRASMTSCAEETALRFSEESMRAPTKGSCSVRGLATRMPGSTALDGLASTARRCGCHGCGCHGCGYPGCGYLRWVAALVVAVSLLTSSHSFAQTSALVTGHVVAPDHRALPGLEIAAFEVNVPGGDPHLPVDLTLRPRAFAETDRSGRFELDLPVPGMWRIRIEGRDGLPLEIRLLPLLEDVKLPPAVLPTIQEVEVVAKGPDGVPLAGLPIRGHWPKTAQGWSVVPTAVETDPNGSATIVLPAAYDRDGVFLEVGAIENPVELIDARAGTRSSLEVQIGPFEPLQVDVVDLRGQPVLGALIVSALGIPLATTNEYGRARIDRPAGTSIHFEVHAESRCPSTVKAPAGAARLEAKLHPHRPVEGVVRSEFMAVPLAGSVVWDELNPGLFVLADASGAFSLPVACGPVRSVRKGFRPARVSRNTNSKAELDIRLAAAEGTQFVTGTVVDDSGQPGSNALLTAEHSSVHLTHTAETSGRFVFPVSDVGDWSLSAFKPGFLPLTVPFSADGATRPIELGRLVLSRGAILTGLVLDARGLPIPDAEVHWGAATGGRVAGPTGRPVGVASSRTSVDGTFSISGLTEDEAFRLEIWKSGFRPHIESVRIAELATDLTVLLEEALSIGGVVIDERDEPIPEAWIFAEQARSASSIVRPPQTTHTDKDGAFRLGGFDSGPVKLAIFADGFEAMERSLNLSDSVTDEFVLRPGGSVSGRVRGPGGDPIHGAIVEVVDPGTTAASMFLSATTDQNGEYALQGLPKGQNHLRASRPGYETARRTLQIFDHSEHVDFELVQLANSELTGFVVDDAGYAVADLLVTITPVGGGTYFEAVTDASGYYELGPLTPGEYRLRVRSDRFTLTPESEFVNVGSSGQMQEHPIRVTSGAVITGTLPQFDPEESQGLRIVGTSRSRSRLGRLGAGQDAYRLTRLVPGQWTVQALADDGTVLAAGSIEIPSGSAGGQFMLDLARTSPLPGD